MTDELINGVGGVETACVGKIAYGTRGEARRHLECIRRRSPSRGLTVYQCDFCHLFHISHAKKSAHIRRTFNLVHRTP